MKEILNPENNVALKSKNLGQSSLSASIPLLPVSSVPLTLWTGPLEGQMEEAPDTTLGLSPSY